MDNSCPSFNAAPRIRESSLDTRRMFAGVSRRSDGLGSSPRPSLRAPSSMERVAIPAVSAPSPARRASRCDGTGDGRPRPPRPSLMRKRYRLSRGWLSCRVHASRIPVFRPPTSDVGAFQAMAMAGQPIRMASGAFCSARRGPHVRKRRPGASWRHQKAGNGDPGRIRTCDTRIRNPDLCIVFVYKNTLCRVYVAS
jgi:hypothetical protein